MPYPKERKNMSRFKGASCLVTGGAQGIGEAIARRFASEGGKVFVTDLNLEGAEAIASQLGNGSVSYQVDVSKSESVINLFDAIIAEHGIPDVVVNNAGISSDNPTIDLPDATWQRELDVNLSGTFYGAREAARRFIGAGRGGAIVNISSIAAFRAVTPELHVGYDVSKAGVAHMTRILAHEWAKKGIRVNAVGPGYTDTLILKSIAETAPEMVDVWRSQTPLGRLMDPSEIAAVVCFLASPDASAITGQTVMADGGYSL